MLKIYIGSCQTKVFGMNGGKIAHWSENNRCIKGDIIWQDVTSSLGGYIVELGSDIGNFFC